MFLICMDGFDLFGTTDALRLVGMQCVFRTSSAADAVHSSWRMGCVKSIAD